jgi:hypothetical protein
MYSEFFRHFIGNFPKEFFLWKKFQITKEGFWSELFACRDMIKKKSKLFVTAPFSIRPESISEWVSRQFRVRRTSSTTRSKTNVLLFFFMIKWNERLPTTKNTNKNMSKYCEKTHIAQRCYIAMLKKKSILFKIQKFFKYSQLSKHNSLDFYKWVIYII